MDFYDHYNKAMELVDPPAGIDRGELATVHAILALALQVQGLRQDLDPNYE